MSEQWTLAEGLEKLFTVDANDETGIGDLVTEARQITVDISFAEGEQEGSPGLSVILTGEYEPRGDEDDGYIMFSGFAYPAPGETLTELAKRIAQGLGVKSDERIWEDGH